MVMESLVIKQGRSSRVVLIRNKISKEDECIAMVVLAKFWLWRMDGWMDL